MQHTNRLINQSSPYLLQHAHNPVDWWPWGNEALQKATAENKPILVSIGYSACHWCHVMERESFENEEVASVMNQHFVCIKIDREERPDVDAIYMDALHAMGGRGGWPLNVFLMPNAKPFYGLTYLPPQSWVELLENIKNAFENHHEQLEQSANGFAENMQVLDSLKYGLHANESTFTTENLETIFEQIKPHFDTQKGGLDRAPKFVMPSIYKFLMRYYAVSKNPEALQQIELSLDRIALGGIYDHVSGGWARYSVDDEWFIPHFEKMLYDNGQLLSMFSEGYLLTKNELYKRRVFETIDWLEREMTSPEGGFYSALDADSEGVEGKYYIWTENELKTILGQDFDWFSKLYSIRKSGNWEHGMNHLHLTKTPIFDEKYDSAIKKLFEARQSKIRPGLDDKILTSWNGLMLKGLVDAYKAFNDPKFLALALKNAQFIKAKLTTNYYQLWHSYKNGKATIQGFLEDYATVIDAYLALYEITFDELWLDEATRLVAYVIPNFYDDEDEFFYFTDQTAEKLIAKKKEIFDNVVPSSNSMMAHNLFKLGTIIEHQPYIDLADLMLSKLKNSLLTDPQWSSNWAALFALRTQPTAEIAIIGTDCQEFRAKIEQSFLPNKVVLGNNGQTDSDLVLLQDRKAIDGKTTIYVCYNKTCLIPVFDVEAALKQLLQH